MIKTTRKQREAVKRVYDRTPVDYLHNSTERSHEPAISYRDFRAGLQGGWDCVMVYWCGMWLGIEPDGYVHS